MFHLVFQAKNNNRNNKLSVQNSIQNYCSLFLLTKIRLFNHLSSNINHESNNSLAGNHLSGRGNDLSIRGINLSAGGNDLPVGGINLSVRGNDLPVRGINLPAGGINLSVRGNDLSIGGNDLSVRGSHLSIAGKAFPDPNSMYSSLTNNIVFNY
jgi:hypothetical protein